MSANKPVIGSYFSGGGIGLALLKGKVDFAFGVEYEAAISEVYRANISENITTARVQDVNPASLPPVDLFQVSPVCKEFSTAKTDGKESAEELSQAAAVCAYLDYHKPPYFLLENVRGYIRSKSFQMIVVRLSRLGYNCKFSVENSANYGVAQTRERLILRAALNRPLPSLPDYAGRWVGWYEAIEDLLPGLPESKFADWQLERLPDDFKAGLVETKNVNQEFGKGFREPIEPAFTVTTDDRPSHKPKAFLLDGTSATIRKIEEPAPTVTAALLNNTAMPRAFLADMFNASREFTVRETEEPCFTVTATHMRRNSTVPKAFIVGQDSKCTTREGKEPLFTLTAEPNREYIRTWLSQGRVVQMTPRALARFQSIPDWYVLPDKNGLACKVIGNGVPSLMGQRIIEAMLGIDSKDQEAAA